MSLSTNVMACSAYCLSFMHAAKHTHQHALEEPLTHPHLLCCLQAVEPTERGTPAQVPQRLLLASIADEEHLAGMRFEAMGGQS